MGHRDSSTHAERRMLLILPHDLTYVFRGSFVKSLSYAPLTLTLLAALVPEDLGFAIDILDEGIERPDYLRLPHYDIVGITCVASSSPRAYELARHFRERGSTVVLGGAHPSLNPEEASQHADHVFVGPAEDAWPGFLRSFCNGEPLRETYRSDPPDVLSSPVPRRDLLRGKPYLEVPTVIASRGCSNHCSFCSIHGLWNRSACRRPLDEVIDEVAALESKRILLLDPNLIADRDYAHQLFERLIPMKKSWAGLATAELAEEPELFDLAVRSGCKGILVGFETAEQGSLVECGKRTDQVSKYKPLMKRYHEAGVAVLGCFVLGFDHDDEDTFDKTLAFIDEIEVDIPRFAVLTPFPGTALYAKYERQGRIVSRDLGRYDTEHVIFQPKNMSPERLQRGLYDSWRKAYTMKRAVSRALRSATNTPLALAVNLGFRHYTRKMTAGKSGYAARFELPSRSS